MKIDNYALTMFQACPAKFDLRILQGWTSRRKSAALGFGGAFHHGIATWYRTGSRVEMLQAVNDHWPEGMPVDDYRTKQKCVEMLIAYTKQYPGETFQVVDGPDGKLIEVSFTLPTGMYLYCPECGQEAGAWEWGQLPALCPNCGNALEEIEYGGIFDGLVEFSGAVYVLEHKTTSQLGASYFDQFRPNNQVTGYTWAAGLLSGKRVGGALINAIGVYKSSPPKFERQISMRSDVEIEEWMRSVHATCERIQYCKLLGYFPLQTVNCTMYGKCEFHSVHSLPHPNQRLGILQQDYVVHEWDYEGRDE
jgi:PD-(D/E)XK nuclease superfamily